MDPVERRTWISVTKRIGDNWRRILEPIANIFNQTSRLTDGGEAGTSIMTGGGVVVTL